jgi:hypothetical protein
MRQPKRGDYVGLRRNAGDDWAEGFVALASGTSVLVMTSGIVRAGGGLMSGPIALTVNEDAGTISGLMGDEYELEVQDAGG